jgi:site-specific DNA-cytosine methylase
MRVLDLFAGTGSATRAFTDAGHEVVTVELDPRFDSTVTCDVKDWEPDGYYDFVWASPPCTAFSVASIGTHWQGGRGAYVPRTQAAHEAMRLVEYTHGLIRGLQPEHWVIENPRGVLRKLSILPEPQTVWYCQYGDDRAKPTDLYGKLPEGFVVKTCRNGASDHISAPREGSRSQGR